MSLSDKELTKVAYNKALLEKYQKKNTQEKILPFWQK